MNAYGYKGNVRTKKNRSAFNTIARFLRAVFEVIAERVGAYEIRVASVVCSFVIALGFVGGMEHGSVPLYIGLPVCLVLAAAALLTHFDD
ncbi:MAG: hypothetical protein E7598_02650 [Ruminococcaceae bacterium]|nr:hypothetical protein [Oscillospiraceae bacterium]